MEALIAKELAKRRTRRPHFGSCERDFRVPINNTLENWSALHRMHVPSRLLVWPDAWHWILKPEDSRHFYEEVQRWLGIYLNGEAQHGAPAARR